MRAALAQQQGPTDRAQSSFLVQWDRILQIVGSNPFDNTRISYDQMYQMRKDAIINLGLHLCYVPIVLADWYMECKDPAIASFMDNALRRIWARFVLAMMNNLSFGHSPVVKRFGLEVPDWTFVDPEAPGDQRERLAWDQGNIAAVVFRDGVPLAPEKVWPRWDQEGMFAGMRYAGNLRLPGAVMVDQITEGPPQTDIDLQHSLWVVNEQDAGFDSIWGWPRTGYAWKYHWAHEYLWALSNRFYEKHADPPMIGWHPQGFVANPDGSDSALSNSERMLNILQSARSGSNIAMPSDLHQSELERFASGSGARQWDITQLKPEGNPQWFTDRFNELNIGKLRAVLAPEQSVIPGQSGQSSRNVAATLNENVDDVAAFTCVYLDHCVNRFVIPDVLRANFPWFRGECRKVTRGFSQEDVTVARQVVQLIGQQDPLALNLDVQEICRTLGLPVLEGAALRAWQQRYIAQAQEVHAALVPPQGGNAGTVPALGNGGGLAPGLNGKQLVQGLQAGDLRVVYVGDRPRIDLKAEDVWEGLEVVRCSELPIPAPAGLAACVHEGKAYVLESVDDDTARRFAILADSMLSRGAAEAEVRA